MAPMNIVKECLDMTEQCMKAMVYLYNREKITDCALDKDIIDEALNQLTNWAESNLDFWYLVRNAMSNAKKKVYRYNNWNTDLAEHGHLLSDNSEIKIVEWDDVIKQADLTKRQALVLLRNRQGYTVKEISLECGVSPKTIYDIRQQARTAISDEWKRGA